jgi:glycine/D-amino acid oxidase-like deaminating enzyme
MTDKVDVVVVGSGALGSSTAFHLAKAGRSVVLVDKAEIGSQTSPRAAGLTGQVRRTEMMTRLAKRAVEKFIAFSDETGEPLEYHQSGSITLARTPEHAALIRGAADLATHCGVEARLISPQEAHELMPVLQPKGILAAGYVPSDVYMEPAQLAVAYARAAARLGSKLVPNTAVREIVVEDAAISRVVTDNGEIRAGAVVDAAGGWLRVVAGFAGVRVPVVPTKHQLMITVPLPPVNDTQPTIRVLDANAYVRPCRGGLMFGGYERTPEQLKSDDGLLKLRVEDLKFDLSVLRDLAEKVHEQFPVLRGIALQEHRGGLPTLTVDGDNVLGPAPGVKGLYVLGGCNVGGFSVSPVLGELMAEWIVSGKAPMDLSRFDPGRFAAHLSEADVHEMARQRYANYYAGS